jgi:coenzyme F420-reducing hydrogenase delta subunit
VDLFMSGADTMSESAGVHVYYCRNVLSEGASPPAFARIERNGGVRFEAVPCSGRLDPRYVLKAFESGATAVCVLACPIGQCRSMEGSARAGRRVELVRELMAEAGLDPNALGLFRPEALDSGSVDRAAKQVAEFVGGFLQSQQGVATE